MKFLCDAMLGKLARYLRVFGLDAEYVSDIGELSRYHNVIDPPYFLTRRTRGVRYERSIVLKADKARDQLREIRQVIRPYIRPEAIMDRCMDCNVPLAVVPKSDIEQLVPEFVLHRYEAFKTCPSCRKVYWAGSHAASMGDLLRDLFHD
jgi:uncharacterized protein